VVISLGACFPVASTLQYLQRALQAPVALQEVISKGPLCAKVKIHPQILLADSLLTLTFLFNLKKIMRCSLVSILSGILAYFWLNVAKNMNSPFSAKFIVK
jgi:hypothetical protein